MAAQPSTGTRFRCCLLLSRRTLPELQQTFTFLVGSHPPSRPTAVKSASSTKSSISISSHQWPGVLHNGVSGRCLPPHRSHFPFAVSSAAATFPHLPWLLLSASSTRIKGFLLSLQSRACFESQFVDSQLSCLFQPHSVEGRGRPVPTGLQLSPFSLFRLFHLSRLW